MAMEDVLFCPFCGEAFEDETRCPAHELRLVPWNELPAGERAASDENRELPWTSLRLGRGFVATGAALTLLAFALPLARVEGAVPMGGSMLVLALGGTPKLWLVPAAAWAQCAILYRRRSPIAMRSARLAVALVACVPVLACVWTWLGAREAVSLLAASTRQDLHLRPAPGAYTIGLAVASMLVGALRFGIDARRTRAPISAA
jgi:hypothetical protein